MTTRLDLDPTRPATDPRDSGDHTDRPDPTVYANQRRAFQVHATVFAATMVLILAVNLLVALGAGTAGQLSAWWSLWALIGWGSGITVHGLVLKLAAQDATVG
ncbi:MAG: 2TM domain-containing protein [Actinomycetota bacterium]